MSSLGIFNKETKTYQKVAGTAEAAVVDAEMSDTSTNTVQNKVVKKYVDDETNKLKKSVSDGKTLVATAITAKGVETAADATFAVMAENISQIETGGGELHGAVISVTTEETTLIGQDVVLSKDSVTIETKTFDDNGTCSFIVQESGDYVVTSDNGTDSASEPITVTSENIVDKTALPIILTFFIDGETVTPVDDVSIWLKCGKVKDKSYTTIGEVIADTDTMFLLMSDENAMKYLARSTGFADAICADETSMTYLGQSAYVDDTVLNSDLWMNYIYDSQYFEHIFSKLIPTLYQDDSHIITNGSNYVKDVTPLWKLFDNDSNTLYQMFDVNSTSFTSGKYVGYSFDDTVTIRRIYFEFSTNCSVDGGHQTKSIQISEDGTNFTTIKSIPITHMQVLDEPFVIINSTYNIKAIRIYVESGAYAHSLNDYELQVYGR